jgi:hypothetical protein
MSATRTLRATASANAPKRQAPEEMAQATRALAPGDGDRAELDFLDVAPVADIVAHHARHALGVTRYGERPNARSGGLPLLN